MEAGARGLFALPVMAGELASAMGVLPFSKLPVHVSDRGAFHKLTDAVPALEPFYFSWEQNYNTIIGSNFAKDNNWIPVVCVTLYGVFILVGQRYMRDRKAFDLRWTLAAWNLFLAVFSAWGFVRTTPHLFYNLYAFSFEDTLCNEAVSMYGCGATGLWVQLFIFSKIPELIDTVFVVLRKKQLIFLHWYHHITVLLFCWHSYVTESPNGIYFAAMNYGVHSIMYFYYFLMAARKLPKWFPALIITIAQISQMVVGVVLTIKSGFLYNNNRTCTVKADNLIAGGLMYFSYFVLFVHFAVERYCLKPKKTAKASKVD